MFVQVEEDDDSETRSYEEIIAQFTLNDSGGDERKLALNQKQEQAHFFVSAGQTSLASRVHCVACCCLGHEKETTRLSCRFRAHGVPILIRVNSNVDVASLVPHPTHTPDLLSRTLSHLSYRQHSRKSTLGSHHHYSSSQMIPSRRRKNQAIKSIDRRSKTCMEREARGEEEQLMNNTTKCLAFTSLQCTIP